MDMDDFMGGFQEFRKGFARMHYKLDGKIPVPVANILEWADWNASVGAPVRLARTMITVGVEVSTIFTGLNSRYNPDLPPLVFETMVLGGAYDSELWKYSTWEEAEAGHERAVALAQADAASRPPVVGVVQIGEGGPPYNIQDLIDAAEKLKALQPKTILPVPIGMTNPGFEVHQSHQCYYIERRQKRIIRAKKRRNRIYLNNRPENWIIEQGERVLIMGGKMFVGPLTMERLKAGTVGVNEIFFNRDGDGK